MRKRKKRREAFEKRKNPPRRCPSFFFSDLNLFFQPRLFPPSTQSRPAGLRRQLLSSVGRARDLHGEWVEKKREERRRTEEEEEALSSTSTKKRKKNRPNRPRAPARPFGGSTSSPTPRAPAPGGAKEERQRPPSPTASKTTTICSSSPWKQRRGAASTMQKQVANNVGDH